MSTIFDSPMRICATAVEVAEAAKTGGHWVVHLVSFEDGAKKFYDLLGHGYKDVIRAYGRIGKKGYTDRITLTEAMMKIQEKLGKGYVVALE